MKQLNLLSCRFFKINMIDSIKPLLETAVKLKYNTEKAVDPSNDLFFNATIDSQLKNKLLLCCNKAFSLCDKIWKYRFFPNYQDQKQHELYSDLDDLLENDFNLSKLIDLIDDQFEKIDMIIEKLSKAKNLNQNGTNSPNETLKGDKQEPAVAHISVPDDYGKMGKYKIIHSINIPRPQLFLHQKVDIINNISTMHMNIV